MKKGIICILLLIIYYANSAIGFDNERTHRDLTAKAVDNFATNSNSYLKVILGFTDGVSSVLNGNTILWWLTEGSFLEDTPNCRASNHFHNPLKPWNESAMSDEPLWLDIWCYGWKPWYSNIVWATGYQAPGSPVIQRNSQTMGWENAREYYYSALTSPTGTAREINFAKTFQAVGQVVHLLEDMAVPAHVRNDFRSHLTYHGITSMNPIKWFGNPFEDYIKGNPDLISSATKTIELPAFSNPRVTDYWDTDQIGSVLGLAEFTNANYFSDSTIPNNNPTSEHIYTSPQINIDSINQYLCTDYLPGSNTPTKYVSRKQCPADQSSVDHFAALSLINSEVETAGNNPQIKEVWLDNNVHNTYAKELLPRAIGYSAGLLNYFFRGKLGITQVSGGIKVKNLGTETMSSYIDQATQTTIGTITLFYDDTSGNRAFLADLDLTTPLEPGAQTDVISFAPPSDNITPKRYIVVFRGKLGNEEGAVIGKVALPPHVYYVATMSGWDKIYKIDADGTNQSIVYDNPDGYYIGKITMSPDGNILAFASSPDGLVVNAAIQTLNLTDTTLTPTVFTSGNWPSWSPDGAKIAFERDISQDPYSADIEIFTVDVATGAETQLTDIAGSSYSGSPAWSPNGNSIAYSKFVQSQTGCATNYVISLMDTAGNSIGSLTCPPEGEYMSVGDFDPAWSPDGQEIAFTRRRYVGRSSQLHKVVVATKTIIKLTDSPGVGYDEYTPAWSFDEMSIAIGSMRDGDYDIWLVDPYGAGYQLNITNANSGIDGYPAFGQ
ncbi:MAG: hypothetical protein M0R70_01400 [Nitrospirae bacterium]|nr:hypothetical protein [Nitrospirota bacterium]